MPLLNDIRNTPLLWLLAFVPVVFAAQALKPEAHTLLFVLSVLAIVPLAALLSHATESVAAQDRRRGRRPAQRHARQPDRAGDRAHGAACRAICAREGLDRRRDRHQYACSCSARRSCSAGSSTTCRNTTASARGCRPACCFSPRLRCSIPSVVAEPDSGAADAAVQQTLSVGLSVLLIVTYGLRLLFSLKTHREFFGSAEHAASTRGAWPIGLALATLAGVTVLVALVSEVFVESVQQAAEAFGMTPAFVGFIVVALVGGAAEMASAFSGARKNRLDLSVGIALGSASQIALFVAPVLVLLSYVHRPVADGPALLAGRGGDDADRDDDGVAGHQRRPLRMVRRRACLDRVFDLRYDALSAAAEGILNGGAT